MTSADSQLCTTCRSPATEQCELCEAPLCRKCRIFLSEDEFPLLAKRPEGLTHTYYCGACNDQHVGPFRDEYEEQLEKAKQVIILFKGSKSTVRVLNKAAKPIQVENVKDRDEAILKLAFEAAKLDFNAVIDVEVAAAKVRNEGWQKSAWTGRGLPAQVKSHESEW